MFSFLCHHPKTLRLATAAEALAHGRLVGCALQEIEEKVALKKIEGVFEHITIAKA